MPAPFSTAARLRETEAALAADPESPELLLRRASLLDALGRTPEARDAYIEAIKRDGTNFDALNNLATLLLRSGYRKAAQLTYAEAIKHHPGNPIAHVNIGNLLLEAGELPRARTHYESALSVDPGNAAAHQGLSYVHERLGDFEAAERHRRCGFGASAVAVVKYRGAGRPVTVLLLLSAVHGNVATDPFLDDGTFEIVKLFADYYDAALPLPPHDVVFNAIGDAERCASALHSAVMLLAGDTARVINSPKCVAATGRAEIAGRLAHIDGLVAPKTLLVERARLRAHGLPYPLLLRSPGYHTGEHFTLIEDAGALDAAAAALPGDELLVIEYLDARGSDGKTRKYRVMIVDGRLYPLHLAIATQWKVHYFTAAMDEPANRAEEAAFLENMPGSIGDRAVRALEAIAAELQLDYAGVDFGVDAGGRVVLFEANAAMKIVLPASDGFDPYRRGPAERALRAAREMTIARASQSSGLPYPPPPGV